MPVCIHLGTKLAVHVNETYEQEQIAALADLGVELRCETLDAALALPGPAGWPCRRRPSLSLTVIHWVPQLIHVDALSLQMAWRSRTMPRRASGLPRLTAS